MTSKYLERIQGNQAFLSMYSAGMGSLFQSGVFEVLKDRSQIVIPPRLLADPQFAAAEAHRARGYNQALDDLMDFVDRFLTPRSSTQVTADFSMLEVALVRGDITQEEADAIRSESAVRSSGSPTASSK